MKLASKKLLYLLLTFFSGFLSGISFNFVYCAPLIWVSLVPFFWVIKRVKKAYVYSFIGGFVHYFTMIFWLSYVTKLGLFLLLLYLSFYWAIWGYICKLFWEKRVGEIAIPCVWVIIEFLRENLFSGFGWGILGYSQFKNTYLIGIADIGGVKAISFMIVFINLLIFNSIEKRKVWCKEVLIIFLLIAGCIFYSFYRSREISPRETLEVSVVQPNISQEKKWDQSSVPWILNQLRKLGNTSTQDSLVIFPEASWPLVVNKDNINLLQGLAKELQRNVLIGAVEEIEGKIYNSAFFLNEKGQIEDIYHKIKLVPFGEYVPLRKFLSFVDVLTVLGDISPGNEKKIFNYRGKKFASLICFEDTFPVFVSKFSKSSHFLVNITNDGWFLGNPEAIQHWGIMVLRAIENRISIVRASNTGISGGVDFLGRAVLLNKGGKKVFVRGVLNFKLPLNYKRSFYTHHPYFFILLVSLLLLFTIMKRFLNIQIL